MQMHTLPANALGRRPRLQSPGLRQLNRRKVPQPPSFPLVSASAGLMVSFEVNRYRGSPKRCAHVELLPAVWLWFESTILPKRGWDQ